MKIEGIINMSPHTFTKFSVKKGQQKSTRSDIDVANVLLQLKEKDEQEKDEESNNYHKKILVEQLIQKNSLNDKFKNSPISISSLNNDNNENNTIYHKNNNPYRSPTSSVYSSPVLGQIDNEIRNVKEEMPNNTPYLPPIKYLLETKIVNSTMKDNILPIPDIPAYKNRMINLSNNSINNVTLEMSKDDLLYFKSFSNQMDDYKVNRRSSYSSLRDNENYIPNKQNTNMPYNNININSTNPSPNSDHMYTTQSQPQHSMVSLPPPSMMIAEQNNYNNNTNHHSYSPYQKPSYYQNNNNFNSSTVSSPLNYNNNTILSEQENTDRSGSELMNVDNNMMIQDNGFNSIDINKTIKLCANGPNASNISSKRFGPIPGKKKEKESRRFPKYIIQILEASYNASHYPSNNEKDRLVRDTKLTHRQINDWFINKRARSSCSHQNKRRNMKKLKQQQKAEKAQKVQ